MNLPKKTPLEDLRIDALYHYDKVSSKAHTYSNVIPRAINFYFDYKQMSFWGKIKQAINKL